jgi:hypothetical protein
VIAHLNPGDRWRDLASVALVEALRTAAGRTTTEQRFYLLDQVRPPTEVNALAWPLGHRKPPPLGARRYLS